MSLYAAWNETNKQDRERLERIWRAWRHRFLASKERPTEAAALLQPLDPDDEAIFVRVWDSVWGQARTQLPTMTEAEIDAEVLRTLLRDTVEEKSVPSIGAEGQIERHYLTELPPDDEPPVVRRSWRNVNFTQWTLTSRILATAFLVLVIGLVLFWPTGSTNVPAHAATRPSGSPAASVAATDEADAACDTKRYVAPFIPGQRTPLEFLSIDVAGTVYEVQPTVVCNKEWRVAEDRRVASWWAGTFTNIAIAVPSLNGVGEGDTIVLRDNNAVVRTFRVETVRTVYEKHIEVLASDRMGVTLIGPATGDDRIVVWATYQ